MAASRRVLLSGGRKIGGGGSVALAPELTVEDFQVNPGTGTCLYPERLNDGVTENLPSEIEGGQYSEIDLGSDFRFKQFRSFDGREADGDGEWKLSYFDGSWHDWITNILIAEHPGLFWHDWVVGDEVTGSKIRITTTKEDSGCGTLYIVEVEVKY